MKKHDPLRVISFYLPQYHPIPENDRWWGKGFTEWTNVVQAKPLFNGHYQPHIPADLGFYDLRLPETRQAQAELAKAYGIFGFCYYHYWFNRGRLLERPFNEVLKTGSPDFPFCLCWANESWMSRWDGRSGKTLMEQSYNDEDDINHIRWLASAFEDKRYIRIDGKPLFLVYRAEQLPNAKKTTETWRKEALRMGIGEICLCRVESSFNERDNPIPLGFDAAIEFQPDWMCLGSPLNSEGIWRIARGVIGNHSVFFKNRIYRYESIVEKMLQKPIPLYPRYPCVTPSWDNSPRRKTDAVIFHSSTPELFKQWIIGVENKYMTTMDNQYLFINAWNEWGEGNHLEPCQKWGLSYLEAVRDALEAISATPK